MLRGILLSSALALLSHSALAEPMSATEATAYIANGPFKAVAGSKFAFNTDGTFKITHSNGSESGTWTLLPDGSVSRMKKGATVADVFFFDVSAKGKVTIVYTAGQYRGDKYPLR